jgi:hypothetical protein
LLVRVGHRDGYAQGDCLIIKLHTR